MTLRAALALLTLGIATPVLSGCVAAALPVAAGATLLAKARLGSESKVPARTDGPGENTASPTSAEEGVRLTGLRELPAPIAPAGGNGRTTPASTLNLLTYAKAEGAASPDKARSALLATPGALDGRRAACRSSERALFLDLDPGRGTFDPLNPGTPQPALAEALANLRAQGLAVVWFSRLGENFAAPLRAALAESGLDRDRRDQVVLMRDIDERKQTRREALADFLCPVALVGDEKADFDELYLYLKSPEAAMALEGMIGQGWFLVSPFLAQAAPPTDQPKVN